MNIAEFIDVEVCDDVPEAAQDLFRRKYHRGIPDFPHHVVASLRGADTIPVCYIHFTDCGDILLGGGACVDNRVLRRLGKQQRELIREAGGLYRYALSWSVQYFAASFYAVFGYCGDALAERVDRAAGFEATVHDKLLVYWTRNADDKQRRQMIEKANAFTPF